MIEKLINEYIMDVICIPSCYYLVICFCLCSSAACYFPVWSSECLSWTTDLQHTTSPYLRRWEFLRSVNLYSSCVVIGSSHPPNHQVIFCGVFEHFYICAFVFSENRMEWKSTFWGTPSRVSTWSLRRSCGDAKRPSVMEWCLWRSPGTPACRSISSLWYVF